MGKFSGFTDKTMKSLVTGSGAYFKNFTIETDTFESAVTSGLLIGASKGGGTFEAKPEIRTIAIDGVSGKAKGMEILESWDVTMSASIIEITKENLILALGAGVSESPIALINYDKVTASNIILDTDYIENITFVGYLTGNVNPIIIQVYNALNTGGLSFSTKDKDEVVIEMTFSGHYDVTTLDTPPFAIFYPKTVIV